ncbi:SCF ubiquitin ligase complex subunit DAS1 SCDLUD_002601 [Saccharomycodes ludwigii]|uniref:SCF ubiquitin ligase complex subunit DAS1 n=1 Tax=Saccharomycodes ludwigii TaxID=36035 RepID=UPI001E8B219E|nr:hypothetical protein SCDLUD_002601 [Saccharomycodes ludwigii]KAH3901120.1 hypothetical protein SCDLUD_002601 [Saccharomycodes ludwigii]
MPGYSSNNYSSKNGKPSTFDICALDDHLLFEVFSHLQQNDRLILCLVNKRFKKLAMQLIYRRIYLNDSNVVRSEYMNLAINWTLLYIPKCLSEEESRRIANLKLQKLIWAFSVNPNETLRNVGWIRINWDLDSVLQRKIVEMCCNESPKLFRLENVTDPNCNETIAYGKYSSKNVTSFEMAPPNSMPERKVDPMYIPNFIKYMSMRLTTHIKRLTLFIDPVILFTKLYPLKDNKLQLTDLKLHWRREFFDIDYHLPIPTPRLSDFFDSRSLRILTVISWNDVLLEREDQMLKEISDFHELEDLSLISVQQKSFILCELFRGNFPRLKRLKMDFLNNFMPDNTRIDVFLSIIKYCKNLEFLDIKLDGYYDQPIIQRNNSPSADNNSTRSHTSIRLSCNCHCESCTNTLKNVLMDKLLYKGQDDMYIKSFLDLKAKDIFSMMRYFSLLPYSKACDQYPSVRTQPTSLKDFVDTINKIILAYRASRYNEVENGSNNNDNIEDELLSLGRILLTEKDVIGCIHMLIHHYKRTYKILLNALPHLRFLVLNDIPSCIVEEEYGYCKRRRVVEPVFYHYGYKSNLYDE